MIKLKRTKKRGSPDMLLIHESIAMSVHGRSRFPELLVHAAVTLLGSFCTIASFQGFFGLRWDPQILLLLLAGYTLLMLLLRLISSRTAFIGVLMSFTVIPVMLLRHKDAAVTGVRTFYRVMNAAIVHEPPNYLNQPICGTWNDRDCLRFVFDIAILAVAALLEYSDVLLLSRRSGHSGFLTRLLVTFPFLECGLYFGLETYPAAVFGLIAFWLASLTLVRVRVPKQEARAKHTDGRTRRRGFTSNEVSALVLLVTAAVLSGGILLVTRHHVRTEQMDQKRDAILQKWDDMTMRGFSGVLQKLPGDLGVGSSGADIELDDIDRLHFSGYAALDAITGTDRLPEDLYLRGMVRGEYTGHGWAQSGMDYLPYKGLFRRLAKAGRMPQTCFLSEYAGSMQMPDGRYPAVNCRIIALNKESVNYLPYQSFCESGAKYRYDTEVVLERTDRYDFWLFHTMKTDWHHMAQTEQPSADEDVREYGNTAHKLYTKVPENAAMEHIMQSFTDWMYANGYGGQARDFQLPLDTKLDLIRRYLWDTCEYDTAPGKTPDGMDYAEYFLTENQRGFCSHYATAAVLLARNWGIPARYCQGYVMTQGNRTMAVGSGDYLFEIPDNQAHAWAEIYVDSYGWMPYEFTEGVAEEWHANDTPEMTQTQTTTARTTVSYITSLSTTRTTVSISQSSASGSTSGTGDAPQTPSGSVGAVLLRILLILLLLAGIGLLWLLWHRAAVNRRQRMMHRKNPSLAADASYQFLVKLLAMTGIRQGKRSHEEFAQYAEEHCPLLKEGEMQHAVEIEQAVVFSQHAVPAEDAAYLSQLAESLAGAVYKDSSAPKRFVLRWVHHIVM